MLQVWVDLWGWVSEVGRLGVQNAVAKRGGVAQNQLRCNEVEHFIYSHNR